MTIKREENAPPPQFSLQVGNGDGGVHTGNEQVTGTWEWPETMQQGIESLRATRDDALPCLRHQHSKSLNRCPGRDSKMDPWPAG